MCDFKDRIITKLRLLVTTI